VQVGNAATALAALRSLPDRLAIRRPEIEEGLRRVRLAGRFQRITDRRGFEWVLDVAHNPDSARTLADNLARYPAPGRTVAVCGMLADKDVEEVVGIMGASAGRWIAADTEGARGLEDGALAARASCRGIAMECGGTVTKAMDLAASSARPGDRIVVFGSFHTVGPALRHLEDMRPDGGTAPVSV
jgi:dihydrofolate synthase/folylpolyglutamate synthase